MYFPFPNWTITYMECCARVQLVMHGYGTCTYSNCTLTRPKWIQYVLSTYSNVPKSFRAWNEKCDKYKKSISTATLCKGEEASFSFGKATPRTKRNVRVTQPGGREEEKLIKAQITPGKSWYRPRARSLSVCVHARGERPREATAKWDICLLSRTNGRAGERARKSNSV